MTYALEADSLTRGQYDELSVCWNNLLRRIFHMHNGTLLKLLRQFGFHSALWPSQATLPAQNISLSECSSHPKNVFIALMLKTCPVLRVYNVNFTLSLSACDYWCCMIHLLVSACGMWCFNHFTGLYRMVWYVLLFLFFFCLCLLIFILSVFKVRISN